MITKRAPSAREDGAVDEIALAENIAAHRDSLWKRALDFVESGVDGCRETACVGAGLFGDRYEHSRLGLYRGCAYAWHAASAFDRSDVAEGYDAFGTTSDDCFFEFGTVRCADTGLDDIFVAEIIHGTPSGVVVGALCRINHLAHAHAIGVHSLGTQFYLVLGSLSADYRHLRDTSEG